MTEGDLVFLDFEARGSEKETEAQETEKSEKKELPLKTETKEDRLKRIASQIESGEYRPNFDEVPDSLLVDLLDVDLSE